jgi:hypothetical protein
VLEILKILEGQASASMNSVMILQTKVEQQVQPLKLRALLLCNYTEVNDPSRETMEMLEAGEVTKWVTRLVSLAIIVVVGNTMEAFSAIYRLN